MSKMHRYLMTQSLLSAWQYIFAATDSTAAYESFVNDLRKKEFPTTPSANRGKILEALAYDISYGEDFPGHKLNIVAGIIAKRISGGQFQVTAKKRVKVCGMDFLIYGRLDCLKAGEIIDIKYTGNYEAGKYRNSPQHPMYMELVPDAVRFRYLISDGKDVFEESYDRHETRHITAIIREFIGYLRDTDLMPLYKEYWKAKD